MCCCHLGRLLFLIIIILSIIVVLLYYYALLPWGKEMTKNTYAWNPTTTTTLHNTSLPKTNTSAIHNKFNESTINLPKNITSLIPNFPSSCSHCKGVDNIYPTNSTGFSYFLDTKASTFVNTVTFSAIGFSTLLALFNGLFANVVASSSTSGMFETLHIIGQAQFCSQLGTLNTQGAPRFFYEFTSKLSWTNLQIRLWEPGTHGFQSRRLEVIQRSPTVQGVPRYAWYLGVKPNQFVYLTAGCLIVVLTIIWICYGLLLVGFKLFKKYSDALKIQYAHKVMGINIQLLLLAHYGLALAGTFEFYLYYHNQGSVLGFILAILLFVAFTIGFICFGFCKIFKYKHELDDVGTEKHVKKVIYTKYGPYYQDYNKENKFFFLAKAFLDVMSGVVVGIVQNCGLQILCLVILNLFYLFFIVWREPYLIRFFFYISLFGTFFRLFLYLLMLIMMNDNTLPLFLRNFAAYLIIGTNTLIFICLFLRQCYCIYLFLQNYMKQRKKKHKDSPNDEFKELPSNEFQGGDRGEQGERASDMYPFRSKEIEEETHTRASAPTFPYESTDYMKTYIRDEEENDYNRINTMRHQPYDTNLYKMNHRSEQAFYSI